MIERTAFNRHAAAADSRVRARRQFSLGKRWAARRAGSIIVKCLGIALRGFLVTTIAAGIVAYLLLTKSTGASSVPWTSNDAERHTRKATTNSLKELWAKVANEALERTGDEGRAVREANAVVARLVGAD
jgi:hypothetical protein